MASDRADDEAPYLEGIPRQVVRQRLVDPVLNRAVPVLAMLSALHHAHVSEGTMSTATSGRAREWKVRDHLIGHGWTMIMRAAASKGPADLALACEEHGLALVQVGTTSKSLGPADRARFTTAARLCSALPILATVQRGVIRYQIVTDEQPRHWVEWDPRATAICK